MEYNATAFVGCDDQAVSIHSIIKAASNLISLNLICNVCQEACLHEDGTENLKIYSTVSTEKFRRIVPVVESFQSFRLQKTLGYKRFSINFFRSD
jgi:hypothetical protein